METRFLLAKEDDILSLLHQPRVTVLHNLNAEDIIHQDKEDNEQEEDDMVVVHNLHLDGLLTG